MGELSRRGDGSTPSVRSAGESSIANIHYHAYSVYKEVTGKMVRETKAIRDEQHFRMVAPMAHATAEQMGAQLLLAAEDASERIREKIRSY
jgi:hypothetical protein